MLSLYHGGNDSLVNLCRLEWRFVSDFVITHIKLKLYQGTKLKPCTNVVNWNVKTKITNQLVLILQNSRNRVCVCCIFDQITHKVRAINNVM